MFHSGEPIGKLIGEPARVGQVLLKPAARNIWNWNWQELKSKTYLYKGIKKVYM